ncbi:Re/Si-specific NAD(P)(+) transhydrogenase subunit alpha [Parvularcula sp. IMCC14364]|uniref:Re/Si-specific NAD(P)(+) transhydrogenase subunit alpha n=1 Tax=Parvularcula sp. IMCC14364 TaxID=3067902 RepID=UPI002740B296|nr:Re/Si-specific NAD(P)(+) transhydrogenase subunit alpha [Parvularcula sp. IMCC14364]
MKLAVLKETRTGESRVAAVPDTVKKLVGLRYDVTVETDAGKASIFSNEDYEDAGAKIAASAEEAAKNADIILKVQRPDATELKLFANGAKLVGILSPYADEESLAEYARAGVDTFSMEFMPRITRAQSMDILSSQSNLAGYKAVIDAAAEYGRAMPMMMTAAGTIAPAKVFVMGAGVAGLQAIATAKRLGAVVSATDVRFAAKEQVESLGGTFVVVDEDAMKDAETEGGYAKEMSDDFKKRQAEFVAAHIAKQDIVITTALIPGRPAPELVSDGMVRAMKPGSVIVDLAVEQGGNVAPSRPGEIVEVDGVKVVGHNNVPGRLAADASSLYAKNILNFLTVFTDAETGDFNIDMEDEIIKGVLLTRDGQIVHPAFAREAEPTAVIAEVVDTDDDVKE